MTNIPSHQSLSFVTNIIDNQILLLKNEISIRICSHQGYRRIILSYASSRVNINTKLIRTNTILFFNSSRKTIVTVLCVVTGFFNFT